LDFVRLLAPYFEPYITVNRILPGSTYDYVKRGFKGLPVLDITMHQPKCTPGSWLYVAVKAGATLARLEPDEKLYVGSQTADRMFRGDGMKGKNFHHAQMRAGNGDRNLENYVRAGGRVDIHRSRGNTIRRAIDEGKALKGFAPLVAQATKHIAYWVEQIILASEPGQWAWNTNGADTATRRFVASLASAQ